MDEAGVDRNAAGNGSTHGDCGIGTDIQHAAADDRAAPLDVRACQVERPRADLVQGAVARDRGR